jgi:hypothetical protein
VSFVILLVLVAVLWIVVLAPGVVRRFSERHGAGSIDHFHHQLQLLEHAGPKLVTPAYRLHTARPRGSGRAPTPTASAISDRPKLVLLRPVDDERSSDIDVDGNHYARVGVIEPPPPPVSPDHTKAELASYRRQDARRRCTGVLRLLTAAAIGTGLLGIVPSLRLAWIFTALTGIAALALVGLVAYARELEGQRRPRPPIRWTPDDNESTITALAHAGYPGAWDDEDDDPRHQAAGGR